jgi:membrane fusion protein, adhesin transport system
MNAPSPVPNDTPDDVTDIASRMLGKDEDLNDLELPSRSRWVMRTLIVGFLILLLWASVGKIDQVTRAPAVLLSSERTQLIQAPDGGVITAMHVQEGQSVKAGQVLVTLQKERAQAAVSDTQAKVAALRIALVRLNAEIDDKNILSFPSELRSYTEYIRNQTNLFIKRRTAFTEDIQSLDNIIRLAQEELHINRGLQKQGDVSRAEVLRLERSLADVQAQRSNRKNKYLQDTQAEMTKAQEDLNSQLEQLKDRSQLLEHTELVAPMDAIVNSIKLTTIGGVARPGETVLELLPEQDQLLAEAKVPPSDIAFVKVGQSASVKLDAYDASIFGAINGEVTYISADALNADKPSPGGPAGAMNPPTYYIVRIKLLENEFRGDRAQEIHVRPGLTALVEIKAMERTVLSYLTKPISKTFSQSLGEH